MDALEQLRQELHDARARAERAEHEATRLRAEQEASRVQQARLRSFFDLTTEGIWRAETDAPIDTTLPVDDQVEACFREAYLAECNAAFARMYGYEDPAELVGARLSALMPPSDARNTAYLRRFIEAGYSLTGAESYEVDRAGRTRVFENALLGELHDGHLLGAWGTQRDVTDRVWASEALRESEARFRALFQHAPVGLALATEQGRYLDVNPAFCALLSRTRAEIIGHTSDLFITPEMQAARDDVRTHLDRHGVWQDEFPLRRPDGSLIYAEWSVVPYPLTGVRLISAMDSTIRHDAETALRASEERFRHLADHVPAMIWLTDRDGDPTYLSRAWMSFTGQTWAEGLDGGWADAIHPDDRAASVAAFDEALATQTPFRLLYRLRRHDGVYRWALDEATPRFDDDGVFLGHAGFVADVDDRVAAEDALRELNGTLEARVAARTAELERSNRDLQSFAHVASHDLQEPLRKIQSFAALLHDDAASNLTDEQARYLDRIRSAATRMHRLVQDLLGYARVAAERRPFVPVDLAQTLEEVRDNLEMRLRDTGGTVTARMLLTVEGDPVLLHQLLQNLVGNALKFHRPGVPPVVEVHATRTDTGVVLTVEDNGIGFAQEVADAIFAPFRRLHGREQYEGTGMGLAIVRRIAEHHGGTVTATGVPGGGSRFVVALPLAPTA